MPDSPSPSSSGGRSGNRGRSRNRNRNRSRSSSSGDGGNRGGGRSRNSGGSGGGGGRKRQDEDRDTRGAGHRTGGYTREPVPRRAPKASLWHRILAIFGLGGENKTPAKAKETPSNKPTRERQPAKSQSNRERAPKKKRAARTPESVEVTTPRLYVGNLSYDTTEEDLEQLFNGVGGVESAEIVTHKESQRSKGFAFVELRSVEEGKRAVEVLHDKDFMGRKITVSGAKSPGPGNR